MTRREFALTPILAAVTVPEGWSTVTHLEGWYTVAHLGRNRNGRAYSIGNLKNIVRDAVGKLVIDHRNGGPIEDGPSLSDAAGVVQGSRLRDDEVQIRVSWFRKPDSGFITPNGRAMMVPMVPSKSGTQLVSSDYVLENFYITPTSSFQKATPCWTA